MSAARLETRHEQRIKDEPATIDRPHQMDYLADQIMAVQMIAQAYGELEITQLLVRAHHLAKEQQRHATPHV